MSLGSPSPGVEIVCWLLQVYVLLLLLRIVLSWFPIQQGGALERLYGLLWSITEPLLRPFRNLLPPVRMGGAALDLSPIFLFVAIALVRSLICG